MIATGQHREMFQQVAEQFGFTVDVDLAAMQPGQTLAGLTARLMERIDGWLESGHPDMALVQGDTTTVLVAALACFYRRIPIGHVEAGLRTGNIWAPFPEEVNRRLASPIVSLHFAPTQSARAALLREGVPRRASRGDRQHGRRRAVHGARSAGGAGHPRGDRRFAVRRPRPGLGTGALRADHRPSTGELRGGHPADLRGHRIARVAVTPITASCTRCT